MYLFFNYAYVDTGTEARARVCLLCWINELLGVGAIYIKLLLQEPREPIDPCLALSLR